MVGGAGGAVVGALAGCAGYVPVEKGVLRTKPVERPSTSNRTEAL